LPGAEMDATLGSHADMVMTVDLRQKAVEVALAVTSGAYQTTLLTYFIQRDLFPSVMKVGEYLG